MYPENSSLEERLDIFLAYEQKRIKVYRIFSFVLAPISLFLLFTNDFNNAPLWMASSFVLTIFIIAFWDNLRRVCPHCSQKVVLPRVCRSCKLPVRKKDYLAMKESNIQIEEVHRVLKKVESLSHPLLVKSMVLPIVMIFLIDDFLRKYFEKQNNARILITDGTYEVIIFSIYIIIMTILFIHLGNRTRKNNLSPHELDLYYWGLSIVQNIPKQNLIFKSSKNKKFILTLTIGAMILISTLFLSDFEKIIVSDSQMIIRNTDPTTGQLAEKKFLFADTKQIIIVQRAKNQGQETSSDYLLIDQVKDDVDQTVKHRVPASFSNSDADELMQYLDGKTKTVIIKIQ